MIGFVDRASFLINQIIFFHDHLIIIIIIIISLIIYILYVLIYNKILVKGFIEGQKIEILWTIIPAIILIFIAFPSLKVLYMLEELSSPSLRIKSIGNQWYWSYEYSDFEDINFTSYIIKREDLNIFRLLEVDNRLVLPINIYIRNLISSTDVLHSWALPSLSLKIDAVPGRLNQLFFKINRSGLFFGQCSEICGAKHSFMPIIIEACKLDYFLSWVRKFSLISFFKC